MLILVLSRSETSLLQFLFPLLYNTDVSLVCFCTNNAPLDLHISTDFNLLFSVETPKQEVEIVLHV